MFCDECTKYGFDPPDVLAHVVDHTENVKIEPSCLSENNERWFKQRAAWLDSRIHRLSQKIEHVVTVPAVGRYIAMQQLHDNYYREFVTLHNILAMNKK
jgi:hypothetical protein